MQVILIGESVLQILSASSFLFVSLVCAASLMRFSMSILMHLLRVDLISRFFLFLFPLGVYILYMQRRVMHEKHARAESQLLEQYTHIHIHTHTHTRTRTRLVTMAVYIVYRKYT